MATGAFSPEAPDPGAAAAVEGKLQAKLPRERASSRFSSLPIPFADWDAVRFYFPDKATPGFAGTLGLSEDGVILPGGALPPSLPATLLRTRVDGTSVELGELDRLILRSPVAGRFRFEPYYVYRWTGTALEPLGPSTTGRLIVEQPRLSSRERDKTDPTKTQVFEDRLFAFEHVDRSSIVPLIHRSLVLQLRFFESLEQHFESTATTEPRLIIPKTSPEVFAWIVAGVNNLIRSWLAYLSVLRWRPDDAAVAGAIPADWAAKMLSRPAKVGDAKALGPIVRSILGSAAQLESLLHFSEAVYARRLSGHTWMEVLTLNGQDPNVRRFPVPKDRPPFTPKNAAEAKKHELLRLVEDPQYQWIACYAGCPVGKPAAVYAPAAAAGSDFPPGGLTTYEVEALHAAGTAATVLGVASAATAAAATPGLAMDLSLPTRCGASAEHASLRPKEWDRERSIRSSISCWK